MKDRGGAVGSGGGEEEEDEPMMEEERTTGVKALVEGSAGPGMPISC